MGLIDIIQDVGKLGRDIVSEIEREQQKAKPKTDPEGSPAARDAREIARMRGIIRDGHQQNQRLKEQRDRKDAVIRDQLDRVAALQRELAQERSTREAIEAKLDQVSEPSTKHVIGTEADKRERDSLHAALADAQKQQEIDTKLLHDLQGHLKALQPAWEKLNKRPLPKTPNVMTRRLNEFAKATGLDTTAGTVIKKIPAKGKKR